MMPDRSSPLAITQAARHELLIADVERPGLQRRTALDDERGVGRVCVTVGARNSGLAGCATNRVGRTCIGTRRADGLDT